ncbi:MAG: protein-L-isoaspartate(D-aspartate) O-methyltransferase [Bacteroides sp.]|jgi:protein-L-isoaspartate(D-aspartate) O-methyltransferase|nr:protein-L-isoaspartate(D-aspartate) O-methyltransferase [Bacteroides sp.]
MYRRKIFLFVFLTMLVSVSFQRSQDPYAIARMQMVEAQIKGRGIRHRGTLEAMERVPRHLFVPADQRPNAYADRPLPIGYGQTISQPFMVGYMTQIIDPQHHFKVLEIGTGSGYQAAILAEMVEQVYTIEIIPELGKSAGRLLNELYNNVSIKIADGYFGWEDNGPFDAIVVTAASGTIPPPLIEQLKDGGKMVIPVGSPYLTQQLMLIEKKKRGYTTRSLMPVRFVPFRRSE